MRIPTTVLHGSVVAWLIAMSAVPAAAQMPPRPSPILEPFYFAWSDGDYTSALEGYLRIAEGARDPAVLEEIAALTGELYVTSEVTPDATGVAVSADGTWLTFEQTTPDGPATRVLRVGVDPVAWTSAASVTGRRATASGSRIAWLSRPDPAAYGAALAQLDRATARRSSLEFAAARAQLEWVDRATATLRVALLPGGADTSDPLPGQAVDLGGRIAVDWALSADDTLFVLASIPGDPTTVGLFKEDGGVLRRVDDLPGFKSGLRVSGSTVLFDIPATTPVPLPPGDTRPEAGATGFGWHDRTTGGTHRRPAEAPTVSADGRTIVYLTRPEAFEPDRMRFPHGPGGAVWVVRSNGSGERALLNSEAPLRSPSLSADGTLLTYARRPDHDWEVFVLATDGRGGERRITSEIQHDIEPRFLSRGTVLALKGESRHRRAYLYDLASRRPLKLFDNNRLRTIAPEYEWVVGPDAAWVAIVAERDGDTVSPERGLYLVDLGNKVDRARLVERLRENLAVEQALVQIGDSTVGRFADSIRPRTEAISVARIQENARVLADMGSKYVGQPGNAAAIRYLTERLRSYGYDPVLQTFEAQPGIQSSNVVATLPGLVSPDAVYVVSSHFDSSRRGPGADDNSSGTTALLEVARVLAEHPQPATIQFAFFTGEEAGLLGSREFVRRAVAGGTHIAGALNNDMVGWRNDHRLDNTIRYSNPGIRDIQHAAAARFSALITYDAKYYKNTDAHAYYEEYGDIVGGIGSYPVLGNPHYHQATDQLWTVDSRLVAEVARTTAASIVTLAGLPARPQGLVLQALTDGTLRASWEAAREIETLRYRVETRAPGEAVWVTRTVTAPTADLPELPDGTELRVRAETEDGRSSWDWARFTVGAPPTGG